MLGQAKVGKVVKVGTWRDMSVGGAAEQSRDQYEAVARSRSGLVQCPEVRRRKGAMQRRDGGAQFARCR